MNFVSSVVPYHLSEDIAVNQVIDIFFFVDVNKQKLTADKVILFNVTEEKSEAIEFEYRNRHLKITPQHMNPDMHYQVQLIGGKDGICDITGHTMEETYVSEFYTSKTKELDPPTLLSPTDLIEISDDVIFQWKPAINATYYELEISRSNNFQNLVWPYEETKIYENSVTPKIDYEKGQYYARIRSVRSDGKKSNYGPITRYYYNGNTQVTSSQTKNNSVIRIEPMSEVINNDSPLQSLQKHFLNQNVLEQNDVLSIVNSTPEHEARNLTNNNGKIIIEFNKEIDPNSVTSKNIYVLEEKN